MPDLDNRILRLGVRQVPDVLLKLQNPARDTFWSRLAKEKAHRELQLRLLHEQLAAVLLDREVVRQEPVHSSHPTVTWGMQEADGYLKLDLQVWTPDGLAYVSQFS